MGASSPRRSFTASDRRRVRLPAPILLLIQNKTRERTAMPTQHQKAERFAALHVAGDPLILFNAWDPAAPK